MTDETLIADLIKAGLDPDLINRIVNALLDVHRTSTGHSTGIPPDRPDPVAEKRREYDRNRKREARASTGIPPDAISGSFFLSSSLNSSSLRKVERVDARARGEFEVFWEAYPNKVGKLAAVKAFTKARKTIALDVLMAALARYVAKTDDRPWCNPTTWLNQGRWEDKPLGEPQAPKPPVDDRLPWIIEGIDRETWRKREQHARLQQARSHEPGVRETEVRPPHHRNGADHSAKL